MKLIDLFIDRFSDTRLFEMAYERKKALQTVSSLQHTIMLHFIKYLGIDSPQNRSHWLDELNAYFTELDYITLKPNGRRLNANDYWTILWDQPLGHGKEAIAKALTFLLRRDYKGLQRTDLTDAQIYEIMEKIYHTVCYDMSNNKFAPDGIHYYIQMYGPKFGS